MVIYWQLFLYSWSINIFQHRNTGFSLFCSLERNQKELLRGMENTFPQGSRQKEGRAHTWFSLKAGHLHQHPKNNLHLFFFFFLVCNFGVVTSTVGRQYKVTKGSDCSKFPKFYILYINQVFLLPWIKHRFKPKISSHPITFNNSIWSVF